MKSFYSILKLSPNIATEDSIAIGLLLFDGENFRTYFSASKKRLANKLLDDKNFSLSFIIEQIIEKCEELNKDKKDLQFFYKSERFIDISYFEYLSNYTNGIIQFSKPNVLYNKVDESEFNKLIEFLFNESAWAQLPVSSVFDRSIEIIEKKLIDIVQNKVHTNYRFTPESFPSIYFNYEMDCIGLNGSLVGAKSLSFDKPIPSLDKNISHYFTLISSLSSKFNKSLKNNNFYLISEEPKAIGSKEHKLWESVKLNEIIKVINPEESGQVVDVIMDKNAAKFLEIE